MKPGRDAIALIKTFEGFRAKPYLCPAGKPTIGYGHTRNVRMTDQPISECVALKLLREDVADVAAGILARVLVPLTQGQFDALISFTYNVGVGNLSSSTLLKRLNADDYSGAADELLRWDKAGGKSLPGLRARRRAERERFLA